MRKAFFLLVACWLIAAPARAQTMLTDADRDNSRSVLGALEAGDHTRARALAEPLAARGDPVSRFVLGQIYERGLGLRPDIGLALEHYSAAAIEGYADAQLALGRLAYEGGGVYPDYERAIGWFRLAAASGDPRADVQLGLMLAEGAGVARDKVAAAHHFAKAAAQNNVDGLFYLGIAWMNGDGVPQNYAGAAKYFSAAAAQGHAEAAYHLALLYETPLLGRADAGAAARYMTAAAEGGYAPAFAAMGLIVHRGDADGVAADWFEKGAQASDPQSTLLYAVALSKGDGRTKDLAAAASYARKLAAGPTTPGPVRAQAERLLKILASSGTGPLSLRD